MPSIGSITLVSVTNWPGIAPCAEGVAISITLDPADKVVIGLLFRVRMLLIFLPSSFVFFLQYFKK